MVLNISKSYTFRNHFLWFLLRTLEAGSYIGIIYRYISSSIGLAVYKQTKNTVFSIQKALTLNNFTFSFFIKLKFQNGNHHKLRCDQDVVGVLFTLVDVVSKYIEIRKN